MSTLYSQLKPAWHQDRLEAMREGQPVAPVHVQIILSDLCNQDCSFCAYRMSAGLSKELFPDAEGRANPKRMIPTEKAQQIIEDCSAIGVRAIQFTGGGEPTVHPDHLELFALAQHLDIETALVTNGVRLTPDADAILRMSWIRISIDAGDAETYARVRRVPAHHWGKVWANVAELASRYQGTLGIGFVVTPDNYRGILEAARLAKSAGAANIRVGAVFSSDGTSFYGPEIVRIGDLIGEAKAQVDGDGFELVDLFGRRIGDLEEGRPNEARCGYQRLTWYIGGDLNVYRCCNTAYTLHGKVASLQDQTLRQVLESQAHEPFDARGCRFCQFMGQNRAINALVERPTHANFV